MNPETTTLLNKLTGPRSDQAHALVAALHIHRWRRARRRALAAGVLTVITATAGLKLLPHESPSPAAPATVTAPPRSVMLSKNELLDSFGDQPVALVTWPDGRQQLLAIAQRPVR